MCTVTSRVAILGVVVVSRSSIYFVAVKQYSTIDGRIISSRMRDTVADLSEDIDYVSSSIFFNT